MKEIIWKNCKKCNQKFLQKQPNQNFCHDPCQKKNKTIEEMNSAWAVRPKPKPQYKTQATLLW